MIITKEQQERILQNYFNEKHNTDECSGFIDGINATIELINNISDSQRLSLLQRAVEALGDYLNAGDKDTRANAADKSKQIYYDYYGKEYCNRNER